jgi:hypothetical protein
MTYAGERAILDADSHVMELADFLDDFMDPPERDRLRRRGMEALAPTLANATQKAQQRGRDASVAAQAEAHLLQDKGWMAMGGFDPAERSRVLDLLGFDGQLLFATFATAMFSLPRSIHRYTDQAELSADLDLLYAGCRAQNQAMNRFCAADPRLLPVAYVSLVDPHRAVDVAVEAIDGGCAAVMVPSTAAGARSPTHPDLDPVWALLQDRDIPFVLHVGGGGRLLDRAFHNNAMPVTDHLGGGENIRSKDYLAIYHSPALFLGALILDGVFDRFPGLRGGCIEQGADWVVSWMRHLDYAQRAFRRTEEPFAAVSADQDRFYRANMAELLGTRFRPLSSVG